MDKSDKTSENLRQILGGFTLSVLRSARKYTALKTATSLLTLQHIAKIKDVTLFRLMRHSHYI